MEDKSNIHSSNDSSIVSLQETLPALLNELEKVRNGETHLRGLSTGFSAVDDAMCGLNKSDLIVLASRPGMGKTSLALNIAWNVAKNSDKTVAIFSLATSKEELILRLLSMEAQVDIHCLKTGQLDELSWTKIATASATIFNTNILFEDKPMLTVENIRAKCQNMDNLGLVVIDDSQSIASFDNYENADESGYEVVSSIVLQLRIMARELGVPLLCLSQVNRACDTRGDKRPQLSDLPGLGAIEEHADVVVL